MSVKLLIEHNLEFLSLKRGCTGSSESTLVKMPHYWKYHALAQWKSESKTKVVVNENLDFSNTLVEQKAVLNETFGDLKILESETSLDEMKFVSLLQMLCDLIFMRI